ncbi:hypothetical protein TSAR_012169 [Trichomalopsis sarcophagae]|uniref:Uncharacterized protein n=1 Tax=Trichomalopsis sarcophagae TaxID=543379 RepID=A0A232FLP7_9HYME|nr:hypothetical protein TSAR_012169 [Trichomalopsis sarcophagae]
MLANMDKLKNNSKVWIQTDCDRDNVFQNIKKFVCTLYTMKSLYSVDNARFGLFLKNYKCNDVNETFKKKCYKILMLHRNLLVQLN